MASHLWSDPLYIPINQREKWEKCGKDIYRRGHPINEDAQKEIDVQNY